MVEKLNSAMYPKLHHALVQLRFSCDLEASQAKTDVKKEAEKALALELPEMIRHLLSKEANLKDIHLKLIFYSEQGVDIAYFLKGEFKAQNDEGKKVLISLYEYFGERTTKAPSKKNPWNLFNPFSEESFQFWIDFLNSLDEKELERYLKLLVRDLDICYDKKLEGLTKVLSSVDRTDLIIKCLRTSLTLPKTREDTITRLILGILEKTNKAKYDDLEFLYRNTKTVSVNSLVASVLVEKFPQNAANLFSDISLNGENSDIQELATFHYACSYERGLIKKDDALTHLFDLLEKSSGALLMMCVCVIAEINGETTDDRLVEMALREIREAKDRYAEDPRIFAALFCGVKTFPENKRVLKKIFLGQYPPHNIYEAFSRFAEMRPSFSIKDIRSEKFKLACAEKNESWIAEYFRNSNFPIGFLLRWAMSKNNTLSRNASTFLEDVFENIKPSDLNYILVEIKNNKKTRNLLDSLIKED